MKVAMVKQVIVIRKDLHMRRGKEIAQGAHASAKWLVERLTGRPEAFQFTELEREWLHTHHTKVTLQVDTEQELLALAQKADEAGLEVHVVTDIGATEFTGPTKTCLAIGPDDAERIDEITGHLRPY
jgi:PTH2 family peptidyl-tRNA hydrolase